MKQLFFYRQSYNNGDHPHTVQWMEEALEKVEIEGMTHILYRYLSFLNPVLTYFFYFKKGDNPSVKKEDIYEYLGFSYYSEGDNKKVTSNYCSYFAKLLESRDCYLGHSWREGCDCV